MKDLKVHKMVCKLRIGCTYGRALNEKKEKKRKKKEVLLLNAVVFLLINALKPFNI